jgi:acyl carrier protein
MTAPPIEESHEQLRARLAALMRSIARRDPVAPFEPRDESRCLGDDLLSDSLDVLEFVVALDRDFGVSIRDGKVGREVLQDLGTLTRFVRERRPR